MTDRMLALADRAGTSAAAMTDTVTQTGEMDRPRRIVLLAAFITLIGGAIYAVNIICSFLLKLAENEHFVMTVTESLRDCFPSQNRTLPKVQSDP